MPQLYKPPVARRTQAVQTARARSRARFPERWRRLWFVPLLGLVPVLVAVVFASQGGFGTPSTSPSASAPVATPVAGPASVPAGQAQASQPGPPSVAAGAQAPTPVTPAAAAAAQPAGQGSGTSLAPSSAPARTPNSGAGLFRAYTVQSGDTVKFVAQMFGVSPASVAQASGLKNADQLRVGQVLTVPVQPGWLYRVQSGETLNQIAARTGVATPLIVSASKLASDSVGPGDVILIPDQSGAAAGK